MGFSDKQLKVLRRNLDHRNVRSRTVNGRRALLYRGLVRNLTSQSYLWL